MNNWIPDKKIRNMVIVFSTLSILVYVFGVYFVLGEMAEIKKVYSDSESESSKQQKFLLIKSSAETNKESIEVLRNFFVKKGDEASFINTIEEISRNASMQFEIESISVNEKDPSTIKEDMRVKMNVEGSWNSIITFLDKVEKTDFGVRVENLSIDAKEGRVWSGEVELVIFREK